MQNPIQIQRRRKTHDMNGDGLSTMLSTETPFLMLLFGRVVG